MFAFIMTFAPAFYPSCAATDNALPDTTPAWYRALPALLFAGYLAASLATVQNVPPIGQDPHYHDFADSRSWLGIAYFADVSSNLAIFLAGIAGLAACARRGDEAFGSRFERDIARLFFVAIALTGLGSTWYHLEPDNARLFWDRLPISLAFTTLLAWLVAERAPLGASGRALLLAWIATGPASVLYWHWGELIGRGGDLRFYMLFYPIMFLLPPLLMRLRSTWTHRALYPLAYLAFMLGMAGDLLDKPVFELLGGSVSGHTLKHLFMGLAVALLAAMISRRTRPGVAAESRRRPHETADSRG